ncbi:hypothetical protein DER45DRAFT_554101 [Fusarium avenaceum]|nr:hypothetical protein DER45DRAFT_554101 [Fusarium avenaceum]
MQLRRTESERSKKSVKPNANARSKKNVNGERRKRNSDVKLKKKCAGRRKRSSGSKQRGRSSLRKKKSRDSARKRRGCAVSNSSGKQPNNFDVNVKKRNGKSASAENVHTARIKNANEPHARPNSDDYARSRNVTASTNYHLFYDGSTHVQIPSFLFLQRNSSRCRAADMIQSGKRPMARLRAVSCGCSTLMQPYSSAKKTLNFLDTRLGNGLLSVSWPS